MSAACTRPDLQLLLGRYEFDGLDLEERHAVEAHVLDCDACFAELERGARAVAAMREHAGELSRVLAESGPAEVPQAVAIGARRPRWQSWRLAPVALAAAVAGIALVQVFRAPNVGELASFPTESLAPEILRSPVRRDAARELLATGAAHFDLGHYDEAARRFRAALEHEPAHAEAAYLAALSTALAGDPAAAVPLAEKAVQLATGELHPRAAWVLANAYLATGRLHDAQRVLGELRIRGGPFGDRAGALLDRIRAVESGDGRTSWLDRAGAAYAAPANQPLLEAQSLFEAERWAQCRERAASVAAQAAAGGDAILEVDARRLTAECLLNQGMLQPAGAEFAKAAEIAAARDDRAREAQAIEGGARVHQARGDVRRALPAFHTVLEASRTQRDPQLECRARLGIGQCQLASGDRATAITTFDAALALARQEHFAVLEARVLQDLAMTRHQLGEREEALVLLEQALQLARRNGKKQEIVASSVRAALIYIDAEQYSRGLAVLREALPVAEELGARRVLMNIRARQAAIYAAVANSAAALVEYDAALEIAREMQSPRAEAALLRRSGHVLAELNRDEEAIQAFESALRINQTLGNVLDACDLQHELGEFHLARGRLVPAKRFLHEALTSLDSIQNPQLLGHVECLLGDLAVREGDPGGAQARFASAATRARALGHNDVLREALQLEAALLRQRGDLQGADARLAQAIELAETVRAGLAGAEHRVGFQAGSRSLHLDRVRVLFEIGTVASHREAFRVMELARARTLLDALGGIRIDPGEAVDPALDERHAQCLRRLRALQIELSRSGADAPAAKAPADSLEHAYQDASRALREIRQEIAARAPSYGALLGVTPPLEVQEVQERVLSPGQTLLEFMVGTDASWVCILDTATLRMQRLPAGEAELENLVREFRAAIQRQDQSGFDAGSRRLYDLLIRPLASTLAAESRLLFVPDGPLFELSFAALHDGERFLVERHAVATAPSASVLDPRLRRDRESKTAQLLAIGNPTSYREEALLASVRSLHDWNFGELPYAQEEVQRIGRHFRRKKILVREAATEEAVKAQIGRATVVHAATHGLLDASEPLLCGLVLAQDDDPREDGLLQVHEILGLQLDADLVVLSACGSGLGQRVGGEGVLGLTRAFMYAGARVVLLSLWEVADRSTVSLMERFYAQRFENALPTDVALRSAQRELLGRGLPPRDWAPFVVTGAVEPTSPAMVSGRDRRH